MNRQVMVVTAAYGRDKVAELGGQRALLPVIAQSGADGVEIRRELFTTSELQQLTELGDEICSHNLVTFYSVPEGLFDRQGQVNPHLTQRFGEAEQLNARLIKFSLGHYQPGSNLSDLRIFLSSHPIQLVVENDQTADCGILAPVAAFFDDITAQQLPIKMTFDMANWHWVNQSPQQAAERLAHYVGYIHVKAATHINNSWHAVALEQSDGSWSGLIQQLPANAPRGIEFPLEGDDLLAVTRHYVDIVRKD